MGINQVPPYEPGDPRRLCHRLISPPADEPRRTVERRPCRVPGGDALWNLTPGFLRKIFSILQSAAGLSVSCPAGRQRVLPALTETRQPVHSCPDHVRAAAGTGGGRLHTPFLNLTAAGSGTCPRLLAPCRTAHDAGVTSARAGTASQRPMPWRTTLALAGACRTKP